MGVYCDIYVVHKDGTVEDVNRRMIYLLNEHCTKDRKFYGFKDHIETIAYRHEFGEYKDE